MKYKYRLASNDTPKLNCPKCGAKKHWQRYLDTITGEALPKQFGRCDNRVKCGFWNDPYKTGYTKAIRERSLNHDTVYRNQFSMQKPNQTSKNCFIPFEVLASSRKGYANNIFAQNLLSNIPFPFKKRDVEKVISLYHLGTVIESGACTFPFIDKNQNVHAIQEKIFDKTNHTDKTIKYHTSWIHSRLLFTKYRSNPLPKWIKEYNNVKNKVSCMFGEHILTKYPNNPVAVLESPKAAIYATLYFGLPNDSTNFIWLAVGALDYLTVGRCEALTARNVTLFPDLSRDGSAFARWSEKALEMQKQIPDTTFKVSDLLENLAGEKSRENGEDIADFLEKLDWRDFRKNTATDLKMYSPIKKTQLKKEIAPKLPILDQLYCDEVKHAYCNRNYSHRKNYTDEDWLNLDDALFFAQEKRRLQKSSKI